MRIEVLAATFWEVRETISALGLRRQDAGTYSGGGKHAVSLHLTGIGPDRVGRAMPDILSSKPDLVIGTGFAGALQEGIRAGDLVLDTARSDSKWSDLISEIAHKKRIRCHAGAFFSSPKILAKADEKRKTGAETGAIAIDMESHSIFEALNPRKIPFLSIRAVSDEIHQDLPLSAMSIDSTGKIGPGTIWRMLTHPGDWPGIFRLGRSASRAEKSLSNILKEFISHV